MKILFKLWQFWFVLCFNALALLFILLDLNVVAAIWCCAATYFFVVSMKNYVVIEKLRWNNVLLIKQLLKTTEKFAEIVNSEVKDDK